MKDNRLVGDKCTVVVGQGSAVTVEQIKPFHRWQTVALLSRIQALTFNFDNLTA